MLIKTQEAYKNDLLNSLALDAQLSGFFKVSGESVADIFIGKSDFFSNSNDTLNAQNYQYLILLADENLNLKEALSLQADQKTFFVKDLSGGLLKILKNIKSNSEKSSQVYLAKTEIQKKRKDLEKLTEQLSSESEQKVQSLEKSHLEENEKNQNEKGLLHFLDFVETESESSEFIEKILSFFWKDLKKIVRSYLVGVALKAGGDSHQLFYFDGVSKFSQANGLDFKGSKISSQLASAWGRPVGKVVAWPLSVTKNEAYLFVELGDAKSNLGRFETFFNDRLNVFSIYLDRWILENEIHTVIDRWQSTFKSFSGYSHVIDENFKIYQSNYTEEQGLCYKLLANRDTPCDFCPVIKNKDAQIALTPEQTVKTYSSQFNFNNKKYFFVIYEDVTKLNQLQSQIVQTEKMSTLGRLGNHLAHELNNPLTGIKSYVQTLMADQAVLNSLPASAVTDLTEIQKATIRCQKIIKNFIEFSQHRPAVSEAISFTEVLQNTLVLLKTALRSHRLFIDIKVDLVFGNAHDLQQVLFNLIKNSCQSMPDKGSLKVYQEIKENKIIFYLEDSGSGFPKEVLNNAFQPFMTTKPMGEGTGLGLYLSKKLMNNMGADLLIANSSEAGTKMALVFDMK